MVIKMVVFVGIYVLFYGVIVGGFVINFWFILLVWIVLGIVIVGIGFFVMYDVNYGVYSCNKYVNGVLGWVINLIGGFVLNWKI